MWAASSRTAARSGSMASTSGKGEGAVIIAPLEYQTCVRMSSSPFRHVGVQANLSSSVAARQPRATTLLAADQQPVTVFWPPWPPIAHRQLGAAQAAEVLQVPARRDPREPRLIRHVCRSQPRAGTAQDPDDQLQGGVRQALG